jgi:MFS superfamily sulfate permease-like transporter
MNLKNDLLASIVVFLVALPLCMGVAIASGVPQEKAAAVGIVTGIVGGIVVGALGGCSLQVSGPAAGLAVMVGEIISHHGFEKLCVILIITGILQLLAGLLRLGQWFRAISPAVIQGMLAGIGVLILASQFHIMVDSKPPGSGKEFGGLINLSTMPEAVMTGLNEATHRPAAMVGVITIGIIMLWTAFSPKNLKFLPPSLISVIVATTLVTVLSWELKKIPVPDKLSDALSYPAAGAWEWLRDWHIWRDAVVLAFVASAESLLTAAAADTLQQHAPRTNYEKELVGQGVGNLICGIIGAIPITGVIVRTSANIQAGAQTRLSTILHGVWLLVFAVAFPFILKLIPVSCLAAILVYTGYKLVNIKAIKELAKYGWGEVIVYFATMLFVVGIDLLAGIMVGMLIVIARLLYTFSHLRIRTVEDPQNKRTVLHLEGAATFIRLPLLANTLQTIPGNTELHVDFDQLTFIDHACLDLLLNWEKQHKATGGTLVIDWESLTARFRGPNTNGGKAEQPATA